MNTYEEYRDSGVEWIGEIPVGWKVLPLKGLSDIRGRIGYRGYTVDDIVSEDEGVLALGPSNISDSQFRTTGNNTYVTWEKYNESPEIFVSPHDVVVGKTASVGKVCIVPEGINEMTINPQMVVLKNPSCDPKFLYYVVTSKYFQSHFVINKAGGSTPTISQTKIGTFPVVHPITNQEQQQIVTYLDNKTSLIDDLIQKKTKKIELLNEYRTSQINQVVTKGLDPGVEMKDSGVEWIGEIPIGWEVLPGRYVLKILTSDTPKEITEDKDGVPLLKVEDLKNPTDRYFVGGSFRTRRDPSHTPLEPGIIVFPKRGMSIFLNKALISRSESYIDPNLMGVTTFDNVMTEFYRLALLTRGLGDLCDQSSVPQINNKHVYPMKVPVPPLPEQQQMVTYLDQKTTEIDNSIRNEEDKIRLLKEYRQSLISEVVTGKIDVREVQVS